MTVGPTGGGRRFRYVAEINMVPFIDIVLVLLIIFMVMTPMMVKNEIDLNPPESSSQDLQEKDALEVTLQIDARGTIFVDGQPVAAQALLGALRQRGVDASSIASIEADRLLPFQQVVEVMDTVKAAGISKISVAVIRKKP